MSSLRRTAPRAPRSRTIAALTGAVLSALLATGAAPAAAVGTADPDLGLVIQVDRDGHGPFTPSDGPGADAGDRNGIVRTFDSVTYAVSMSANRADAQAQTVTLTAPADTGWSEVPSECTGPGSGIDGADLTCDVGTLTEGSTVTLPATLRIDGAAPNGRPVSVRGVVTAAGTGARAEQRSPSVTVSAAPRFDLAKDTDVPVVTPEVVGPDGRTHGIAVEYPITVHWAAPVDGQGLLGAERSTGSFAFEDDVSGMHGDAPSDAVLFAPGGAAACGPNTAAHFRKLPDGAGGGVRGVADSGRFSCSQPSPGSPVTIRIDGVDTAVSPASIPSENAQGSPIQGGVKPYVVVGYVSLWMPTPPGTESFIATNRFTPLRTTSISGATNYPGGAEPLGNNSADRNIASFLTGGGYKAISRVDDSGRLRAGSAREGDPFITANDVVASTVEITNPGLSPYRGAVTCDVFDNRTLQITRFAGRYATVSGFGDGRIQYAARAFTDPRVARDATCGDSDATWYDTPDEVPGGLGAVGMVRAEGSVRPGGAASLRIWLRTQSGPDGTRAYNFGQLYFGDDGDGTWQHDRFDADLGAGGLADSVIITADVARITKRVVDPGSSAADTPDLTNTVTAGGSVEFALYPTLTNLAAGANPTEVTVEDVLPVRTTYRDGSASRTPDSVDEITTADGARHQRLRWTIRDAIPDVTITPVTYRVDVSPLAPPGPVDNTATISTPRDASPVGLRTAARGLEVLTNGALGVQKRAVEPTVVIGDALRWELEYVNTGAEAITGLDLIDVFPAPTDGSARRARLAATIPDEAATGTTARYTSAGATSVSLDAGDPSNRPDGSTRWCTADAFGSVGCPTDVGAATAIRLERDAPVAPGGSVVHELTLVSPGSTDGDRFTNRFGLRSATLPLPVVSNPASVTVVSGSIGDRVWHDLDEDGRQDHEEPGVAGVRLEVHGVDDRGAAVRAATTSGRDGSYAFSGLRPGEYTVHVTPGAGYGITGWHVGADRAVDSDFHQDGASTPVALTTEHDDAGALSGVTHDPTVDAGLVTAGAPVDPDVPGGPGGTGGAGGTAGPGTTTTSGPSPGPGAPTTSTGAPGVLAFTGAAPGLLALGLVALVVITVGLVSSRPRRRS